jgi:hypothetical protein
MRRSQMQRTRYEHMHKIAIDGYNGFIVSLVYRPLYKALCTRLSNAQLSTQANAAALVTH